MKYNIVVALIAVLVAIYSSWGNNSAWYKDAISVEVVPPYLAAYDALANKIIQPVIDVSINDLNNETHGQDVINELVKSLSCGVKTMQTNLTEAFNDSQSIANKLDNEIAALVLSIGSTEREISTLQNNIASLGAQVAQAEEQVRGAEQAVADKQNAVNAADGALAEAQRAVERARDCRGKRFVRRLVRRVCCCSMN